jgi:hypothetical protein
MDTRFAIGYVVLYEKDGMSYEFEITEIKIDSTGIWYAGEDAGGIPVGYHKEKFLSLV